MESRRINTSNIGREACARRLSSCCLEGPRGFPGKDGVDGANGTSGVGTFGFSSGIIAPFIPTQAAQRVICLGQGSSLSTSFISTSLRIQLNGFSIPIPRDGTLSNFVVSAAQNTVLAFPVTYTFYLYRIPSSLGGIVGPAQPSSFIVALQLTFPATTSSVPLQASIENVVSNVHVLAGDRLGVAVVAASQGGILTAPISPTLNASFDYNYL